MTAITPDAPESKGEKALRLVHEWRRYEPGTLTYDVELWLLHATVKELHKPPSEWELALVSNLLTETDQYGPTMRDVIVEAGLFTAPQMRTIRRLFDEEVARRNPTLTPDTDAERNLRDDIEQAESLAVAKAQKAPQSPQKPSDVQTPPPAPEAPPTPVSAHPEPPPAPAKVVTPDTAQRKPRGVSTDNLGEVITETFTCSKCGNEFTRPKTRGRKPTKCEDCLSPSRRRRRRR